jgi:hypothetical protein
VKKIDCYFEEYVPYQKIRDRKDQGPNCNWGGVPPACRKMAEAPELSELEDSGLAPDVAAVHDEVEDSKDLEVLEADGVGHTWQRVE